MQFTYRCLMSGRAMRVTAVLQCTTNIGLRMLVEVDPCKLLDHLKFK